MRRFFDWLDNRTGFRRMRDALLLEHIPGGAKWRYVWGSALAFVFMIQLITGILLMTAYSPSDGDAWGSVHYIQYQMDFGWLVRGLHHFGSQTMVVLMGLHMLQVVIAGAHLPPREINWWLGLALMGIVLGLSLTGYLLPWDQKGYYATQVATNILSGIPLIGGFTQKVLVGGTEYGHQTLTHFFALHVGILPPLLIVFLILHIAVFRRHGVTAPLPTEGLSGAPAYESDAAKTFSLVRDLVLGFIVAAVLFYFKVGLATVILVIGLFAFFGISRFFIKPQITGHFWPDQAFRDLIVCLWLFAIMLTLVLNGHAAPIEGRPVSYAEDLQLAPDTRGYKISDNWTTEKPKRVYHVSMQAGEQYRITLLGNGAIEIVAPDGKEVANQNSDGERAELLFSSPTEGVYGVLARAKEQKPGDFILSIRQEPGLYESWAKGGRAGKGAYLDAPADPMTEGYPARPEWYFLFLFQLLKYFEGDQEIIGTVVIPGAVGLVLFLVPLLGYGRMRKFGHFFGILVVSALLVAVAGLTVLAIADDAPEEMVFGLGGTKKAKDFHERMKKAEEEARIAVNAAMDGLPSSGAREVVRNNPLITGKKLFQQNCASCHAFDFKEPPDPSKKDEKAPEPKASDLTGFGTKQWIRGFLENPGDKKYFGYNKHLQEMVGWRDDLDTSILAIEDEAKRAERKKLVNHQLDEIAWWLAEQAVDPDERRKKLEEEAPYRDRWIEARKHFKDQRCFNCHYIETHDVAFEKVRKVPVIKDGKKDFEEVTEKGITVFEKGDGTRRPGPSLTGYGSQDWVHGIVLSPAHNTRYGGIVEAEIGEELKKVPRNAMPAFRPPDNTPAGRAMKLEFEESMKDAKAAGKDGFPPEKIITLTDLERELIVRFFMRDERVVFGGQPISGPKKSKK